MSDGVLINNSGTIVSVLHGVDQSKFPIPSGQTLVTLDSVSGLQSGQLAPTEASQQLAATDYQMSRGAEDVIVAVIQAATLPRSAFSADLLSKINARRLLRNEGTI